MATGKPRLSAEAYAEGITRGDRLILSKGITLVESMLPGDRQIAAEVLARCMPYTGKSYRIGITGVPGVGKSTFIDKFGMLLIDSGMKVAILAVDPSSARSRGSILGDKTRMEALSHHPQAFVRPSPAGVTLGGIAGKTREAMLLCEAAGFDALIIETVGVGQSEYAVRGMVDFFLLLMLPNAGDEIQGIKKGIMEMADSVVINKADGDQLPLARRAKTMVAQALHFFPQNDFGWKPEALLSSSLDGTGLSEIRHLLLDYRSKAQASGDWERNRKEQAVAWMEESIHDLLIRDFFGRAGMRAEMDRLKKEVLEGRLSPNEAAFQLISKWKAGKGHKKKADSS